MKAVFKGYKKDGYLEFTVGNIYELSTIPGESRYKEVTDDDNSRGILIPGDIYDFDVLITDDAITCSKLSDYFCGCEIIKDDTVKNPQVEQKRFTYYINEVSVTKERFDSALSCVKDFETEGVDASSIKFELKFE